MINHNINVHYNSLHDASHGGMQPYFKVGFQKSPLEKGVRGLYSGTFAYRRNCYILLDKKKIQNGSDTMFKTLHVIFDGKVLRPDGPVDLVR